MTKKRHKKVKIKGVRLSRVVGVHSDTNQTYSTESNGLFLDGGTLRRGMTLEGGNGGNGLSANLSTETGRFSSRGPSFSNPPNKINDLLDRALVITMQSGRDFASVVNELVRSNQSEVLATQVVVGHKSPGGTCEDIVNADLTGLRGMGEASITRGVEWPKVLAPVDSADIDERRAGLRSHSGGPAQLREGEVASIVTPGWESTSSEPRSELEEELVRQSQSEVPGGLSMAGDTDREIHLDFFQHFILGNGEEIWKRQGDGSYQLYEPRDLVERNFFSIERLRESTQKGLTELREKILAPGNDGSEPSIEELAGGAEKLEALSKTGPEFNEKMDQPEVLASSTVGSAAETVKLDVIDREGAIKNGRREDRVLVVLGRGLRIRETQRLMGDRFYVVTYGAALMGCRFSGIVVHPWEVGASTPAASTAIRRSMQGWLNELPNRLNREAFERKSETIVYV